MPYTAEISRINPTCLIFLVDQSSSMLEPFAGQEHCSKADGVADALNRLLQNLCLKCARAEGVRDFFHVGLIGYGGRVTSAFGGALAGMSLVPISQVADNPIRVDTRVTKSDDGAGGVRERKVKFPIWFESRPTGKTPMCGAIALAHKHLEEFLTAHPACFPPAVINITDGDATDGDPLPVAEKLQNLASSDGPVLVFNAHLSDKPLPPVTYPADETGLPDAFARRLFRMSSPLPAKLADAARADLHAIPPQARGFVFNADLLATVKFLDVGTRLAQGGRV